MASTSDQAGAIRCVVERFTTDGPCARQRENQRMSRIIKEIEVEGKPAVALFDTGATFTYVLSSLISETPRRRFKEPAHVALGGRDIDITELCFVEGKIDGLGFFTDAVPIDRLGRADGHQLDALLGALTMERWEINLEPKAGERELESLGR